MKYIVVIKHLGRYYVQKESTNSNLLEFPTFEFDKNQDFRAKDFNSSNIKIKKAIASKIISDTPFYNSKWTGEKAYKSVSLQRFNVKDSSKQKKNIKLVIFTSNAQSERKKNKFIPYMSGAKEWCTPVTQKILDKLKLQNNWSTYLFFAFAILLFALLSIPGITLPFNTDALPFVFAILGYLVANLKRMVNTERHMMKYGNCPLLGNVPLLYFLLFVGMFVASLCISFHIPSEWNSVISKIGIVTLIIDSAIGMHQREI